MAGVELTLGAATLTNRWSFNETSGNTAADSVGGQHATLMNTAFFDGTGQAYIGSYGVMSGDPTGAYIALPDNLVTGYTSVTMETWYTPLHGGEWARIWDFWNESSHFFMRSGNATFGLLGDLTIPPNQQLGGPPVPDGVESHVVWTSDVATGVAKIYVNGVQVAAATGFTNAPAALGPTTNWLGRSRFGGYPNPNNWDDPYLAAHFNEFRIYNGALNPLAVAASYQFGADTPSVNFGAVTNINLALPTTLLLGNSQDAQVTAAASGLANTAVSITGEPGLSYDSSNTGILTVDAAGKVTAVGLGSANITATYVLNDVTNFSTKTISVISIPAKLIHRYSFDNEWSFEVTDSVGGAHGTVIGAGIQSAGKVTLDGQIGTYVNLPPEMITTNTIGNNALTFETWASFGVNGDWVNLFAFGNTVSGGGGNHVWFSPRSGAGDHRLVISHTQPGWSGAGEQGAFAPGNLDNRTDVHIACVVNFGRDQLAVYINGVRVAQNIAMTRELAHIINNFSYLGKSTYDPDPYLVGEIDEFRIYDGALSAQQIVASYQTSGPNSTNVNPGAFQGFALSAPSALVVGWQSARLSVLGNWQNATNVNLFGDLDLSVSSSDTNVATISAAGIITAIAPGTTTISATYQGNTSSQLLTVVASTATLHHRYAFNETAGNVVPDLVGGADGYVAVGTNTLGVTNAAWTGTGLIINTNGALGAEDTYVDLPAGIISALTNNATIEFWVTCFNPDSDYWVRVFDVGSLPGPPFPSEPNFYYSRGGRVDWSTGSFDSGAMPANAKTHVVILYNDDENQVRIFRNGAQVGQSALGAVTLALNSINDTNVWLGRSLYSAPITPEYYDPYLRGEFDEFRIYSGLLSLQEIMANYVSGPEPQAPSLRVSHSAGTLTLAWPTSAAGYVPYASPVLGADAAWTAVPGTPQVSGDNYQLSVPMTDGAQFFRLHK